LTKAVHSSCNYHIIIVDYKYLHCHPNICYNKFCIIRSRGFAFWSRGWNLQYPEGQKPKCAQKANHLPLESIKNF
jgi:hypothetical protein